MIRALNSTKFRNAEFGEVDGVVSLAQSIRHTFPSTLAVLPLSSGIKQCQEILDTSNT